MFFRSFSTVRLSSKPILFQFNTMTPKSTSISYKDHWLQQLYSSSFKDHPYHIELLQLVSTFHFREPSPIDTQQRVMEIFHRMKEEGIAPTSATYALMFKAFKNWPTYLDDLYDAAMHQFKNHELDESFFRAFLAASLRGRARHVFNSLPRIWKDIQETRVTVSIPLLCALLSGCRKTKNRKIFEQVERYLYQRKEEWDPNVYAELMRTHAYFDQWRAVHKLFETMKNNKIPMSGVHYMAMIKCCFYQQSLKGKVFSLAAIMKKNQILGDNDTYRFICWSCENMDDPSSLKKLVHDVVNQEFNNRYMEYEEFKKQYLADKDSARLPDHFLNRQGLAPHVYRHLIESYAHLGEADQLMKAYADWKHCRDWIHEAEQFLNNVEREKGLDTEETTEELVLASRSMLHNSLFCLASRLNFKEAETFFQSEIIQPVYLKSAFKKTIESQKKEAKSKLTKLNQQVAALELIVKPPPVQERHIEAVKLEQSQCSETLAHLTHGNFFLINYVGPQCSATGPFYSGLEKGFLKAQNAWKEWELVKDQLDPNRPETEYLYPKTAEKAGVAENLLRYLVSLNLTEQDWINYQNELNSLMKRLTEQESDLLLQLESDLHVTFSK